ncbi:MAG: histidine kinase, partial [Burkholderiales bacterium]|nr:histidine kinase [Burkholderiales bacterium]
MWKAVLQLSALFAIVGLGLQLIKPNTHLLILIVVANVLGWAFILVLVGMQFNYRQIMQHPWRSGLRAMLGVSSGLLLGFTLGAIIRGKSLIETVMQDGPLVLKAAAMIGVGHMLTLGIVAVWRNKAYETITMQLALDAEREKNARQESESQLRMLRAQIEPHFLFNTLGAVQTLAEQGAAAKAAQLTANLIVFLRACMHEIRSERISLREEFAMVR